jgi:hypothetical protein
MLAEATDDIKQTYSQFVTKTMQIASAKDLDFLLAQLRGDTSDLLLKAVETVMEDDEPTQIDTTSATSNATQNDTLTSASFIMPVQIEEK